MSRRALLGLLDSLEAVVQGARWSPAETEWAQYTSENGYSSRAMAFKERVVADMVSQVAAKSIWDLGANTGTFSRLAAPTATSVVSLDADAGAVDLHYNALRATGSRNVLPLLCDLTNPSPALGWAGTERLSLLERGPADLLMALALVHHLAIGNNVPLTELARCFSRMAPSLIIEFVPKSDRQCAILLGSRDDVFPDYSAEKFETAFRRHYRIASRIPVEETERILYRMERIE